MHRLALAVGLAAMLVAPPVSAKCAMGHLRGAVLTSGPIPVGGTIVIAATQVPYDVTDDGGAVSPALKVDVDGKVTAPDVETIAPGLVALHVPRGTGDVKLRDAAAVRVTIPFGKVDLGPVPPAPKVVGITSRVSTDRRRLGVSVVAQLDGPAPAEAVALVLADAKGTPRSFGTVIPGGTSVVLVAQARCEVLPDGTVVSGSGDKVTVFWVDKHGRRSPRSKVVTIAGTPVNTGG